MRPASAMQLMVLLTTLFSTPFGTVKLCEPDSGTDYTGCDIKLFEEVRSWKECIKICFYTKVAFIRPGPMPILLIDR